MDVPHLRHGRRRSRSALKSFIPSVCTRLVCARRVRAPERNPCLGGGSGTARVPWSGDQGGPEPVLPTSRSVLRPLSWRVVTPGGARRMFHIEFRNRGLLEGGLPLPESLFMRLMPAAWVVVGLAALPALALGQQPREESPVVVNDATHPVRMGDLVRLRIWREEDLSGEFQVDADRRSAGAGRDPPGRGREGGSCTSSRRVPTRRIRRR